MKKIVLLIITALVLSVAVRAADINVSAAASLTEALREIAATYQKKSHDKIVFNFGASSFLARQIEAGAPGDIFFSADESKMDDLEKAGLIQAPTRTNRLSGSLVIVVPHDSKLEITSAADLATAKVQRVALGDPAVVPAGVYARKYLESENLWPKISPKVIAMDNVRAALAFVESGNVDAGIVYKTDAAISKKVKITLEIPRDKAPKIAYTLALLKDAKPAAQAFLDYLNTPAASVVFKKYGFLVE